MLTQGEDVEVHALAGRGWSISAIARHLGRDRKTVRAYVSGQRTPGVRNRVAPDPLEPFVAYLAARFADDPHLWLTALFDEVVPLGYARSYPSFARGVRQHGLRPHCERCTGVRGRATIEIEHPPGDEIQWDWFERRRAPWGGTAHVLLGTLPYSGRVRGVISTSQDQPHLVEALDGVMRRLGGTTPELHDSLEDRHRLAAAPPPPFGPAGPHTSKRRRGLRPERRRTLRSRQEDGHG